jgi:hypothetical protein
MRPNIVGVALSAALMLTAGRANADFVEITYRLVDPPRTALEALVAPVPAPSLTYQFLATTDGDILSIDNIEITTAPPTALYQHPFGDPSNANPPTLGLDAVFPSIVSDSWFDTPGASSRLGPDLPGDGTTTFGDLSNDGPQADFIFAQLTFPLPVSWSVSGRVSIAGGGGTTVYNQPFNFVFVPEPASASVAAIGLSAYCMRSRRGRNNYRA